MIAALAGRLIGNPYVYVAVAAAAFLSGMWTGARLQSIETYVARAETAEVLQDIAERELAGERLAREEAERRADKAARIAAGTAEQARNLTVEVRRLRETHRDITTIFREEPVDPTCDCSLSPADRQRLLGIPATAPRPATSPQPPTAPGRGGAPVQRPRG